MSNHTTAPSTIPSAAPTSPQGSPSQTPTIDHLGYWKSGLRELKTFRGHSHGVWTVAYAPDGQTIVSGGVDRYVRVWDIETGRLLRSLRGHTADIRALVFTPDGRTLASGSEDRTIRIWNPKTGEPTKLLFTRYDHNVCSLSLSPDGLMLARGSHNKDIAPRPSRAAGGCRASGRRPAGSRKRPPGGGMRIGLPIVIGQIYLACRRST